MTVGENIRKIRKEKGLTQKQLGKLCQMNEVQIRQYELGKANPKIETVDRIASALGVRIIDIMEQYKTTSEYQVTDRRITVNESKVFDACALVEEIVKCLMAADCRSDITVIPSVLEMASKASNLLNQAMEGGELV